MLTSSASSPCVDRAFRGNTPRDAFAAVRSALGDDAIIVATREERAASGTQIVVIARATSPRATLQAPRRPAARTSAPRAAGFELAPPLIASRASLLPAPSVSAPPHMPPMMHAARAADTMDTDRALEANAVHQLAEKLVQRGVAEHIARRVAERSTGRTGAALAIVLGELAESTETPWVTGTRRRVVALVGPTGVGKTTTVAKAAARALLDHKAEVGLITLDTWRIGAVEHMRRYGEIMDVPTAIASDAASLQSALARMGNRDLILIDTAGRSPVETASFEDQMRTLAACPDVEIHLAVAAGSSVRQLRAIRERYTGVNNIRLIVTKLDEADGPGALLNVAAIVGRPVAAFTDGQRVPEDIHPLEINQFAAQVLA